MKLSALMLLGATVAGLSIAAETVLGGGFWTFLAFTGGAIFGKGYGIWEERHDRRRALSEDKT